VLVLVRDNSRSDQPGDGRVTVKNQHFLAILDESDIGAELGLQFADPSSPHRLIVSQCDLHGHI